MSTTTTIASSLPPARVSLDPPRTLQNRAALRVSRRRYGAEIAPLLAMAHSPRVLRAAVVHETLVGRLDAVPPRLTSLAVMAAAHRIGCSWCTDFGYWAAVSDGVDGDDLAAVPAWRSSDRFDELDRAVLAFAEAASGGDPAGEIDDADVALLRVRLGEEAFVELAMMVAIENQRSRFNTAVGLTSQGFRDRCEVPGR